MSGHLIADVPLGVFLSSGLDSTAIVALASAAQPGLHTFTVIFPEQEFSEAEPARATAHRFGTRHEELMLDGAEMLAASRRSRGIARSAKHGWHQYIFRFVGGATGRVEGCAFRTWWRRNLWWLCDVFVWPASGAPRRIRTQAPARRPWSDSAGCRRERVDAAMQAGSWPRCGAMRTHCHTLIFSHARFIRRIMYRHCAARHFPPERMSRGEIGWRKRRAQAAGLDSFGAISCLEARSYMVNTLLRDTDSVSMAHSLEVRVPLLDHVLVEFVTRLPAAAKQRRGVNKALLVEALRGLLPEEIVQPAQTHIYVSVGTLAARFARRTRTRRTRPAGARACPTHSDASAVQAVWLAFEACKTNWSRPWSLYVLNQWCRQHLEAQPEEEILAARRHVTHRIRAPT